MKIATYLFLIVPFLVSLTFIEEDDILMPEYANQPMYVDMEIGELTSLESQTLNMRSAGTSFNPKLIFFYKGKSSSMKLGKNDDLKFRVKMMSPQIDPRDYIQFGQFEVKRNRRDMIVQTIKSNGSRSVLDSDNLKFKRLNKTVYEISIKDELEIGGEYAIVCGNRLFAFGIVK
ncbi:hypothetical protein JYT72_00980 [Crocinitomix catalasitica]|nr:hypothetical protein [Crocinitomix catalasitica]